jgi:hypothetical protein
LNRELEALGRQSSYVEGAVVVRGDASNISSSLYRGHQAGLAGGQWLAVENPMEIGRMAYSDLLAINIENIEEVSSVKLPVGTPLEVSLTGGNKWGTGGGIQVRILNAPQKEWFTKIGSFVKGKK